MLKLNQQQKKFNEKWLSFFKHKLGIETEELNITLEFFLASAMQSTLNYINRNILPESLEFVVINLAAEIFRNNEILLTEDESVGTDSVQLASARINFGLSGGKRDVLRGIIDNRIRRSEELNQFRSLFRF
ncbi:MAG: phage head-tail connector protein [Firmicutes bacterium]|nr:phage head-tail connector protein [Bacillota bacterium]